MMPLKSIEKIIAREGDSMEFEAYGLECRLVRTYGKYWCGYVKVPKDSILSHKIPYSKGQSGVEERLSEIEVHGGLTYAGDKFKTGDWWYGFDCAHAGDLVIYPLETGDATERSISNGDVYRNKKYVVEECMKLASQLFDILNEKQND